MPARPLTKHWPGSWSLFLREVLVGMEPGRGGWGDALLARGQLHVFPSLASLSRCSGFRRGARTERSFHGLLLTDLVLKLLLVPRKALPCV